MQDFFLIFCVVALLIYSIRMIVKPEKCVKEEWRDNPKKVARTRIVGVVIAVVMAVLLVGYVAMLLGF